MKKRHKEILLGYLFLLPALALLSLFFLYPLINVFWMSFHKWPVFGKPKWLGLDNFYFVLTEPNFWMALKFTLYYTLTVTPMLFIVAFVSALICNAKMFGTTLFRSMYFLPVVMSFATASFIWIWLYSEMYGVLIYLIKSVYLFFSPAPWTEYSLEGVLDSYQLAAGLWSGQAWGILPGAYDDEGDGGQDVVGTWGKENGMFKLDFRKFKKPEDNGESKKLWQFIGKGATSADDYFIWSDYLVYDRSRDALLLRKRTDGDTTYKPGKEGDRAPRLYPERRFIDKASDVKEAELVFARTGSSGISWELFLGFGFLLSCSMYFRNLNKILLAGPESF